MLNRRTIGRAAQRGLSLVEMMVGITVGLLVVAGASVLVSGQLADNRRLVAEAQLQQDLRATADIMLREIRRANAVNTPADMVWNPAAATDAQANPHWPAFSVSAGTIEFEYVGDSGTLERGFRLNAGGVIESKLGTWQALTDGNAIEVTRFDVVERPDGVALVHCPNACPDGSTDCWPRVTTHSLQIDIEARSRAVPEIERRYQTVLRLRNDAVPFDDAAANRLCPP